MRAVCLDLGSVRIGVAISNSEGTVAVPYEVIIRSKDRQGDHRKISLLAEEVEAECVVVGLPYSLDGSIGTAAKKALAEIKLLRKLLDVPVETYDERFSTVTADQYLKEMNLGAVERRKMVDSVAASIILQAWLDHRQLQVPIQVTQTEYKDPNE
ncbi:MAG: Holliday junction resolvase RuvX [Microthrixaceae bacterium]